MDKVAGVAVLLARAGSKGLPNKNIIELKGHPLIYHTLQPLSEHPEISKVIVSTDGKDISSIVEAFDLPKVEVQMRPPEIASDTTTTKSTLQYVCQNLSEEILACEFFVYMQVTEPLRPRDILSRCIDKFRAEDCDSVFAAFEMHKNFWLLEDGRVVRLSQPAQAELPRQAKKAVLREDTGICAVVAPDVFRRGERIGSRPLAVTYDHLGALIDIHSEGDLTIAERLMDLEKKSWN